MSRWEFVGPRDVVWWFVSFVASGGSLFHSACWLGLVLAGGGSLFRTAGLFVCCTQRHHGAAVCYSKVVLTLLSIAKLIGIDTKVLIQLWATAMVTFVVVVCCRSNGLMVCPSTATSLVTSATFG